MPSNTPADTAALLETFLLRLFSNAESRSMGQFADLDLSFTQVRTLMLLSHQQEPLPINEVAQQLRMSVASAGRNLDRLVNDGLVLRQEDAQDRRVKLVGLTAEGADLMAEHVDCHRESMTRFTERLDAEDRRRLTEALRPILAGDALRREN